VANYFESAEWQETKRIVDEKIKANKPEKKVSETNKALFGEGVKVEINWELVKLFNTGNRS